MIPKADHRSVRAALILAIASSTCWGQIKQNRFALTKAVPDDVFLCVAERHNRARAFLDDYWGEVLTALQKSGIGTDVMELIRSLINEEGTAEVDRLTERASSLFAAVDWKQLRKKQMVFAERLPRAIVGRTNIRIGVPDFVWLFQTDGDAAAKNYEGLVSIADAVAEEINKATGMDALQVDKARRHGCKSCCLNVVDDQKTQLLSVGVALHGDVIVIAVGKDLLREVLDLLDGKGTKKAIADEPRFKAALSRLPDAKDGLSFFDIHGLLTSLQSLTNSTVGALTTSRIVNASFNDAAMALNGQAIKACKNNNYKQALDLITQAHEAAPSDSLIMYNMSCFYALAGDAQEAVKWLEKSVDGGFYDPRQIATDPDLKSIRHDARYKAALAKAAEKAAEAPHKKKVMLAKHVIDRLIKAAGVVDHVAWVESTEGYATRRDALTVLSAEALQNPLYPIFGKRKPLANFDRYLPKETVSFTVDNGIDLLALYTFVEDFLQSAGRYGQPGWERWKNLQETLGFDLRKDVLSWIDDESISITLGEGTEPGQVWMIKVTDETLAREKIASLLTFLSGHLQEWAAQNPMLGMLTLQTEPSTQEGLEGFHKLHLPISPKASVCGVKDGFLIFGTSEEAVALCLATAAGKHPNIRENARVMAQALIPQGPVQSIRFKDRRKQGKELAALVQAFSMGAGMGAMMIPNPKAQQTVAKIVRMLAKLGPVVSKIDFYKSTAGYTTSDGKTFYTRSVTHYKPPAERHPAEQQL